MLSDFRPYTTNPSADRLREIATEMVLAQAAWRNASTGTAINNANDRIGRALMDWSAATATVWWTRGWREIKLAANEG